ncbi:MAG: WecB/TagA/CpsF family glycosyltransferase [bacterium]|nr:WecB/TagA/CpsF family glycosyltransferase [bacterium]
MKNEQINIPAQENSSFKTNSAKTGARSGKINILGIKIDNITGTETLNRIGSFLNSANSHYIVTANPEIAVLAHKDREFQNIVNNADLIVPDGIGLIFASKIIFPRERLGERIRGIDLIYRIAKNFDNPAQKIRIFFLGARGEGAKLTAEKIKKNFPNIEIAGFFGGDASEEGDRIAVSIIDQSKPNILFIAYGAPLQEKWIARNLKKLPTVKLAIGVGGAFDMINGKITRAPRWMRNAGLEWFWRLIKEPRRIGRIYNATIKFTWLVLTNKSKKDKM